ncbi:MAG: NMD3-related protein, partial [Candidatus Thermoplasmatota archaeon]|nr:NMD3-related protein [Candidatus Thermoplasmatota archaeon]
GVCLNCYLKTNSFTEGPGIVDLLVCTHCNSYKYKSTWTSELFGDVMRRVIKNTFTISRELKRIDINITSKEEKDGMMCKVFITGFLDDVEITEEHDLLVRLKRTVCDVCSKRFGGYHEAIVQIRGDKRNLSKKELDNISISVERLVETMQAKGNRGLFVTDVEEEHGGLDFYISDKGSALVITKKIQEQYSGTIKQSSKNMGMKDSRQIYRMTYLLRLPSFRKGDFVSHDGSYFYISSISGNKVHVFELSNWDEHAIDVKELQKAKVLGSEDLITEMLLVSQTSEEVQVMSSKTYEMKIVRKPKPVSFDSEKIKVVKIEDRLFLPPKT